MEAADWLWPLLKGTSDRRGRMRAQGVMEKMIYSANSNAVSFLLPPAIPPLAAVRVKGHEHRTDEKTTPNVTGTKKVFRQKLAEESSGSRTWR